MLDSLSQTLSCRKDTTAQACREVILDHILSPYFVAASAKLTARARVSTAEDEGALIDLRIRDVSLGDNQPVRLEYAIESHELKLLREEESIKHKEKTRLDFIRSIYDDIAEFWRRASRGRPELVPEYTMSFLEDLRGTGIVLAEKLVPERILRALWAAWRERRIGAIRVLTREPSIPWELLYLRDPDRQARIIEGCFFAELGLVRWNASLGYPPTLVQVRLGRAFYSIPEYPERWHLKAAQRDRELVQQLYAARPIEATRKALRKLLEEESFDLFHAACHGEAVKDRPWDSGLLLTETDPTGMFQTFRAQQVQATGRQESRPLVFLNACQAGQAEEGLVGSGGLAQAFLAEVQAGILAAPMWSVQDDTASTFAAEFHTRLANGASLARATKAARAMAKKATEPSWLAYSVWGHPFARVERHQANIAPTIGAASAEHD